MIKIVKVTGNSLSPFFLPDDYALVCQLARRFKHLSPGDFVVFHHEYYGLLIKKVVLNNPIEKYIEVEGVNPDSLSTQTMGRISYENIIGKVIRGVHRPA